MTIGDTKLFQLTQGGVSADVLLTETEQGTVVKITATHGVIDLNAFFWDIVGGDNKLDNVVGLTNNLNMNGVGTPAGTQWDDARVISPAGSHQEQLTAGTYAAHSTRDYNLGNISVEDFNAFGIRAGGNKMVSTDGTFTAAPVDPHHNGALTAEWTFENHIASAGDNTGTPTGFWNLNQWAADHPGIYGEDADHFGFSTDIQVHGVDGHRALDTAASPGNIFLQAIPEGRGGVLGQGATMPDLVAGKTYHAEVSILKQDYSDNPALVAAGTEGTDPDAWVSFQFNDTVLNVHASDIHVGNEFVTFDTTFQGIAGEDSFTIMSHGTHDDAQGLLIDTIQVHEWVI